MNLTTVISYARSGELSDIATAKKTDQKIVDYINLALLDMYSRWMLNTEEIIISLRDGKTTYSLDGTDSDVQVNNQNIVAGSILTLVEARDEEKPIPINDDNDLSGIFQISYDKLQVPLTANQSYISVIYKPTPTTIAFVDAGEGVATNQIIPLPMGLLQPLLKFIAYRAHMSLNTSGVNEASQHFIEYEQACALVQSRGVVPMDQITRDVDTKGFV